MSARSGANTGSEKRSLYRFLNSSLLSSTPGISLRTLKPAIGSTSRIQDRGDDAQPTNPKFGRLVPG